MKMCVRLIAPVCMLGLISCQHAMTPRVAQCTKGPAAGICTGNTCRIEVSVDAKNNIVVSPYELELKNRSGPKKIVWKLADPAKFKFTANDGPKNLKNERPGGKTDDFSDGSPTDDDDGKGKTREGKNYRIDFANKTQGQRYSYTIQFREKSSGNVLSCDPYINNQNE